MRDEIKNYIAEKIFTIAFLLMPKSEIKLKLSVWYIKEFGGNK